MKKPLSLSWVALFLSAQMIVLAQAADKEQWPQWRGPNRNDVSASTGLNHDWEKNPPKLLWKAEGLGAGFASVSIFDDVIYSTGNFKDDEPGQYVVAMSAIDGTVKWKSRITEQVPQHDYEGARTTPTYDQGNLYVVSSDGAINCLKAADGKVVWSKSFQEWGGKMMSGWGFSESPLVDGDLVVFTPGGDEAAIVACNKQDGNEVWRCAVGKIGDGQNRGGEGLPQGAGYSSIVISEGEGVRQYVQLLGQGLVGIRASDGKLLWGYEDCANGVANISTPIIEGNFIFCSTAYGAGSALLQLKKVRDGVSAKEVYFLNADDLQNHHGGMVLKDGFIYCGHGQNAGLPKCIRLKDGKSMWKKTRGAGDGSAAVTYADGHLIYRYDDGNIGLVEAQPGNFKLKGSFKPEYQESPSWAHPVVVDGKLFLREQNVMMCYDLKAK